MQTGLNFSDWAVFAIYFVIVTSYGFWIYNQNEN
jgi:Na+/proline symporter